MRMIRIRDVGVKCEYEIVGELKKQITKPVDYQVISKKPRLAGN